jgi:hypothetical protein
LRTRTSGISNSIKFLGKFAVPVANQEANICLAFGELPYHLSGLLCYPTRIGIIGVIIQPNCQAATSINSRNRSYSLTGGASLPLAGIADRPGQSNLTEESGLPLG